MYSILVYACIHLYTYMSVRMLLVREYPLDLIFFSRCCFSMK